MARFKAGGAFSIRLDKIGAEPSLEGRVVTQTSTTLQVEMTNTAYVTLSGYNFSYGPPGPILSGTITGLSAGIHGINGYTLTGLNISGSLAAGRLVANDGEGFFALLLSKNDTITGSRYKDYLKGYAGKDVIKAGGGNDTLVGGDGSDTLYGGAGEDTFIFNVQDGGVDRIADFSSRSDKIHIDWAGGRSGVGLGNFVYGPQALDAEDRVIYDQASGRVYFDPDGTGYKPQILLAKVKPGLGLTDDNFLLI
jgi:Ca2+-binding RTX toxin-like protein